MIVEYIRYSIDEPRQHEFETAYEQAQAALDTSAHCLGYELARCVDERSSYVLRIEWDSAEGHLQGFRRSAEFKEFLGAIRPYVGDIAEMRHYEPTQIASA